MRNKEEARAPKGRRVSVMTVTAVGLVVGLVALGGTQEVGTHASVADLVESETNDSTDGGEHGVLQKWTAPAMNVIGKCNLANHEPVWEQRREQLKQDARNSIADCESAASTLNNKEREEMYKALAEHHKNRISGAYGALQEAFELCDEAEATRMELTSEVACIEAVQRAIKVAAGMDQLDREVRSTASAELLLVRTELDRIRSINHEVFAATERKDRRLPPEAPAIELLAGE